MLAFIVAGAQQVETHTHWSNSQNISLCEAACDARPPEPWGQSVWTNKPEGLGGHLIWMFTRKVFKATKVLNLWLENMFFAKVRFYLFGILSFKTTESKPESINASLHVWGLFYASSNPSNSTKYVLYLYISASTSWTKHLVSALILQSSSCYVSTWRGELISAPWNYHNQTTITCTQICIRCKYFLQQSCAPQRSETRITCSVWLPVKIGHCVLSHASSSRRYHLSRGCWLPPWIASDWLEQVFREERWLTGHWEQFLPSFSSTALNKVFSNFVC